MENVVNFSYKKRFMKNDERGLHGMTVGEMLELMFESQDKLDKTIQKERKNGSNNLLEDTFCALSVEVGEFANESRAFKHWSNKGRSEYSTRLEEFVDCLHFILSLGNQTGLNDYITDDDTKITVFDEEDETEILNDLFLSISIFRIEKSEFNYRQIWNLFMTLAHKHEFTFRDILDSYFEKHDKNYERIHSGY